MDMSTEDMLFDYVQKGKGHGTWTYWGHSKCMSLLALLLHLQLVYKLSSISTAFTTTMHAIDSTSTEFTVSF